MRLVVGNEIPDRFPLDRLGDELLTRWVGAVSSIEVVSGGPAEAFSELGFAAKAVLDGATEVLLVGALESRINPFVLDSLTLDERLFLRGNPWGCIPGEACVLVLVGRADPKSPALGDVLAIFRGQEDADLAAPRDIIGRGLARAFELASEFQAPYRVIMDLNGERWRAEELGFAVACVAGMGAGARIAQLAADPEAPTLQLGDCGTAMGLLLPALALAEPPQSVSSGPIALVSVSSRGGLRAVGFIERTEAS